MRSPTFPKAYGGGSCEGSTITVPTPASSAAAHAGAGLLAFSTPIGIPARTNMTLWTSVDGGLEWSLVDVVDPAYTGYSSLAAFNATSGGKVGIAWEAGGYETINYRTYTVTA